LLVSFTNELYAEDGIENEGEGGDNVTGFVIDVLNGGRFACPAFFLPSMSINYKLSIFI
jgi:hypothetical protein